MEKEILFTVTGMTCGGCERNIKQALERLAGVKTAAVDRTKQEARVTVEEGKVSPNQMVTAIQTAGKFQARLVTTPSPKGDGVSGTPD